VTATLPSVGRSPTAQVLSLAWPATLSFLLNNAYRINDQFWIQGLGPDAQSAIGAMMFVAIMTFALYYFSAGGTLSIVARAEGAGDRELRDTTSRHAVGLAIAIGLFMFTVGPWLVPTITSSMQLTEAATAHANDYLSAFYSVAPIMVVVIATDHIFIGRGYTIVPMVLQFVAVGCNYFLNPILIYGANAPDAISGMSNVPGMDISMWFARYFEVEGSGLHGAAMASGISRGVAGLLAILLLHFRYGTSMLSFGKPAWGLLKKMAIIAAPVSWSIAIYAGVYWLLFALVLKHLDPAVSAGFAIGFQVFDGISFPVFLGIGLAGSSLVGRSLGSGNRDQCLVWVKTVRRIGYTAGVFFALFFYFGAPHVAAYFTDSEEVADAARIYAMVIAFSQLFVAIETVNEKFLLGSGYTKPIARITFVGNVMRLPIAYVLALTLGLGGAGVWWAINISTYYKAYCNRRAVQRGDWLKSPSKL
jgi:putative MATE family efflux protein